MSFRTGLGAQQAPICTLVRRLGDRAMRDEQFKQYVEETQAMILQTNRNLEQVADSLRKISEVQKSNLNMAAGAYDMSCLVIRVLTELHVDFRTMLIRFSQEPATNPAAQDNRDLLLDMLAEVQRAAGEKPSLKPVPPTSS